MNPTKEATTPPELLRVRVRQCLRRYLGAPDKSAPEKGAGPRRRRIVLAVSGGGDSVALMHVMQSLAASEQLALSVCAVDHGLREESAGEVDWVGEEAARLSLPFDARRLTLAPGGNLQGRAREARYAALQEVARIRGAGFIALGHTLDDQAETVLGRVLRGSGIRGLAGIHPLRADGILRPLLGERRRDLRAFLRLREVQWVEDPSNADERFERVRIRGLLATLLQEDPAVDQHLAHLAEEAVELEQWLADEASRYSPAQLAEAPRPLRIRALRQRAESETGRSPRRAHLDALDQLVQTGRGEVLLGDGWRAIWRDGSLVWEHGAWHGRSQGHE